MSRREQLRSALDNLIKDVSDADNAIDLIINEIKIKPITKRGRFQGVLSFNDALIKQRLFRYFDNKNNDEIIEYLGCLLSDDIAVSKMIIDVAICKNNYTVFRHVYLEYHKQLININLPIKESYIKEIFNTERLLKEECDNPVIKTWSEMKNVKNTIGIPKLMDLTNGIDICGIKNDITFGEDLDGISNAVLIKNNIQYRVRVETLILNNGKVYLEKKDKLTQYGTHYKLPGGSLEPNLELDEVVQMECNEEARVKVKNITNTGISYISDYNGDYPQWHIDKLHPAGIKYEGAITLIFTAEYDGEYHDTVTGHAFDDMYQKAKFYKISEVQDLLSNEHVRVLFNYNNMKSDSRVENVDMYPLYGALVKAAIRGDMPILVSCINKLNFDNKANLPVLIKARDRANENHHEPLADYLDCFISKAKKEY